MKPEQLNQKSQVNSEAVLARARAVRQTPKGIKLAKGLQKVCIGLGFPGEVSESPVGCAETFMVGLRL